MSVSMRVTFVLLAALVLAPAAYAAKPNIQWNKDYDFSHIKTYAWQDPTAPSLAQSNPFMHKFIQDEIEKRLTASGLMKAAAGAPPDIWVTYHGSVMNNVQLQSDSFGYGFGGYGGAGWGMYGYGAAGPVSTTTRVVEYLEGTLVARHHRSDEEGAYLARLLDADLDLRQQRQDAEEHLEGARRNGEAEQQAARPREEGEGKGCEVSPRLAAAHWGRSSRL